MSDTTRSSALGAHCQRCASAVHAVASPSLALATFALQLIREHHSFELMFVRRLRWFVPILVAVLLMFLSL